MWLLPSPARARRACPLPGCPGRGIGGGHGDGAHVHTATISVRKRCNVRIRLYWCAGDGCALAGAGLDQPHGDSTMQIKFGLISADSHAQLERYAFTKRMSKAKFGNRIPHVEESSD